MSIRFRLGGVVAAAAAAAALMVPASPAQAIDTSWTYEDAFNMALHGVGEPYTWGGGWWYDNNSFRPPCNNADDGRCGRDPRSYALGSPPKPEGPDCSGYVAKVWAVTARSAENEHAHPYPTKTWWDNATHSFDGRQQWKSATWDGLQPLDAMVRHNGSDGHIVLYHGARDDKGKLETLEAMDTAHGVVNAQRDNGYMRDNYRPRARAVWAHGSKNVH